MKNSKHILAVVAFVNILILLAGARNSLAEEYTLSDLYRIAVERSERIKISSDDLYIARRERDKARAALIPDVSAFGAYRKYSEEKLSSSGSTVQPDNYMTWGVRADQSLSLSGREITAYSIAGDNIRRKDSDLYAVKEGYIFSVAVSYYNVLRAGKGLEIARANVERLTKHRDAAQIRLKVGEVTKTALLRAEAELSGANSELVRAENAMALSRAVLARTVGISDEFTLKDTPLDITGDMGLDVLKEQALSERAELKSMELAKRISEKEVKFAQGAFWPVLSLEAVYSRNEQEPANSSDESIYGGVQLSVPLFEGGLRRASISQASARLRQAENSYSDLRDSIGIEVEEAYLEMKTNRDILKSLEDQAAFSRDNYMMVSKQFDNGLASSLDVMDANTLLVTSEQRLTDAMYDYRLSILKLQRASGVLFKTASGVGRQTEE